MTPRLTIWLFSALLALVAAQSVPAHSVAARRVSVQSAFLHKTQRPKKNAPQQIEKDGTFVPQAVPWFDTNPAAAFLPGFDRILFQRPPPPFFTICI